MINRSKSEEWPALFLYDNKDVSAWFRLNHFPFEINEAPISRLWSHASFKEEKEMIMDSSIVLVNPENPNHCQCWFGEWTIYIDFDLPNQYHGACDSDSKENEVDDILSEWIESIKNDIGLYFLEWFEEDHGYKCVINILHHDDRFKENKVLQFFGLQ